MACMQPYDNVRGLAEYAPRAGGALEAVPPATWLELCCITNHGLQSNPGHLSGCLYQNCRRVTSGDRLACPRNAQPACAFYLMRGSRSREQL